MQSEVRRKLAMAVQQREGSAEERAAVGRRSELRRRMLEELLPHLVDVGREVGQEKADLAGKFRLPSLSPLRAFRDMTRSMLDLALKERERFVAKGLSRTLLDDLSVAFGEFEDATAAAHEGRRYHVGASADLTLVTGEIVKLVHKLDRLNRYRFRKDPELKAAWESARVVVGPFGSGPVQAGPEPKGRRCLRVPSPRRPTAERRTTCPIRSEGRSRMSSRSHRTSRGARELGATDSCLQVTGQIEGNGDAAGAPNVPLHRDAVEARPATLAEAGSSWA